MAGFYLLADKIPDVDRAFVGYTACNDRSASRRHFVENTDVEIAVKCECERARDGSGSHDQNVGLSGNGRAALGRTAGGGRPHVASALILLHQFDALQHTEPVLLINYHQPKVSEFYFLLNQRMRDNNQLSIPLRNVTPRLARAIVFQ